MADERECTSCGEGMPRGECKESKRECGHHCECSWVHDRCHWCGAEFGEEPMFGLLTAKEHAARCARYSYGMRCTLAAGHDGDHRTHDGEVFRG